MIPREILAALRTIEIHTARLANEQLSGTYKSSFKGQGLAFSEVRPYQPGDDVRTIDWNVSARMNDPFVKVFTEEREMTVMIAVDLSASERFGTQRAPKARVASEVAALLAFSAIRNNDRVGLILSTSKVERIVPPKKGEKHVMRVVREILGFEAPPAASAQTDRVGKAPVLGAATDLKSTLEALAHAARRRSVAFVISDFFTTGYERALSLASAKHDVIPVVLTDRREIDLPDVGVATFEDLESGEMVVVDTSDARVREHYKSEMLRLRASQRQLFLKLGCDSCEIETGGSFVKPIRDLFAPPRAPGEHAMKGRQFGAFALAVLLSMLGVAHAQGPDAGIVDAGAASSGSATGCVESIPKGADKPIVSESFPARGTSGWAATLAITVRHGKGEHVLPAGLDLSAATEAKKYLSKAGFTIPDQGGGAAAQLWTEPDNKSFPFSVTHLELPLVVLPEKPGRSSMELPPLPVAVARSNGEVATVCTHPHVILVEDPTANTPQATPKGNPAPRPQREEWTALKKALLWGSLGLLAGALIGWFAYRQAKKPKPVPPPPPPRPPWEIALERLDEVRHAGLLDSMRHAEYFDRVNDAVRAYLGARFGFDGLESTSDEILASLKKQAGGFVRLESAENQALGADAPAPGVPIDDIRRFLGDCDLVKFANLKPSPEQCTSALTVGEHIVRKTMPFSRPGAEPPVIAPVVVVAPAPAAPPLPERSPWEPPSNVVRIDERPGAAASIPKKEDGEGS